MSKLPTDRQVKALIKLYREAEERLKLLIMQAVESGALGTEAGRRRQLALVQAFLRAVQEQGVPVAAEVVTQGYREGLVIADGEFTGGFTSIHQEAVNVLVQNLTAKLNDATTKVGRQVEDIFRRETLRESALQLAQGGTRRQATDQLINALHREGKTSFIDKAGREWGLDRYTAMAIRTTTREATTMATLNRFIESGTDLVSISEVPDPCKICRPLQGKTYSLTGTTEGYERLYVFPPFHPNCRHVLLPARENFEVFEKAVAKAKSLDDLEEALAIV